MNDKPIMLTGDRPTGRLHLGHYVGSLKQRVAMQETHSCFIVIADFQVLIDHLADSKQVEQNIFQIVCDYLAVGIDPAKTTVFIQSAVPQLADLTMYLGMLVSVARLRRNPTVKAEAARVGQDSGTDQIPYGFLGYPVSQAADILLFRAHHVPAGEDQRPHIEQTRELARKFNDTFGEVFPLPEILVSGSGRLPGLSGEGKMSKSGGEGNAIFLSDPPDVIRKKLAVAVTDPQRVRRDDPGDPMVCPVYHHHDAFRELEASQAIAGLCRSAGIGCIDCKAQLAEALIEFLQPIQERRKVFEADPAQIKRIITQGTQRACDAGSETMRLVRKAVGYNYPALL